MVSIKAKKKTWLVVVYKVYTCLKVHYDKITFSTPKGSIQSKCPYLCTHTYTHTHTHTHIYIYIYIYIYTHNYIYNIILMAVMQHIFLGLVMISTKDCIDRMVL